MGDATTTTAATDKFALLDSDEALKPVLELAQESATSNISTIRTVVLKALSDPKIFCGFDQIKQVLQPQLSSLKTADAETILRTLDLFSYGKYSDYTSATAQYLSLNDTQVFKLRQLTILTLVQEACSSNPTCQVSYASLARELGFAADGESSPLNETQIRQVEEVALACVYARVLSGKLCQKTASLSVTSRQGPPCRPRDVPLARGSEMLAILQNFHASHVTKAYDTQTQIQNALQLQLDSTHLYHKGVWERTKKAESNSLMSGAGAALIGGGVRGWPDSGGGGVDDSGRMLGGSTNSTRGSTSSRRQTKRSRGGVSGVMDSFTGRY